MLISFLHLPNCPVDLLHAGSHSSVFCLSILQKTRVPLGLWAFLTNERLHMGWGFCLRMAIQNNFPASFEHVGNNSFHKPGIQHVWNCVLIVVQLSHSIIAPAVNLLGSLEETCDNIHYVCIRSLCYFYNCLTTDSILSCMHTQNQICILQWHNRPLILTSVAVDLKVISVNDPVQQQRHIKSR